MPVLRSASSRNNLERFGRNDAKQSNSPSSSVREKVHSTELRRPQGNVCRRLSFGEGSEPCPVEYDLALALSLSASSSRVVADTVEAAVPQPSTTKMSMRTSTSSVLEKSVALHLVNKPHDFAKDLSDAWFDACRTFRKGLRRQLDEKLDSLLTNNDEDGNLDILADDRYIRRMKKLFDSIVDQDDDDDEDDEDGEGEYGNDSDYDCDEDDDNDEDDDLDFIERYCKFNFTHFSELEDEHRGLWELVMMVLHYLRCSSDPRHSQLYSQLYSLAYAYFREHQDFFVATTESRHAVELLRQAFEALVLAEENRKISEQRREQATQRLVTETRKFIERRTAKASSLLVNFAPVAPPPPPVSDDPLTVLAYTKVKCPICLNVYFIGTKFLQPMSCSHHCCSSCVYNEYRYSLFPRSSDNDYVLSQLIVDTRSLDMKPCPLCRVLSNAYLRLVDVGQHSMAERNSNRLVHRYEVIRTRSALAELVVEIGWE